MKKIVLVALVMLGISAHAEKYGVTCLTADGRAYLNLKPEQIRDVTQHSYGTFTVELVDGTVWKRKLKLSNNNCIIELMGNDQTPVLDSLLNK